MGCMGDWAGRWMKYTDWWMDEWMDEWERVGREMDGKNRA